MPDPKPPVGKEREMERQPRSQAEAAAPGHKQPEQTAPPAPPAPPPDSVTLTIDGQSVTVPKGTLVVEAAKTIGIEIPVFCYHHKLAPVGACRLCLVEMSPGPPKPNTACTTPVAPGMVVKTGSAMAVAGRADILEFELVNHPLDCPVCDKGGECPLQDYTFRHGFPTSRVNDAKLHFAKPVPLSDFIALDRERCVLCYRCTRYYDEIAWEQELTSDMRGASTFITSQFDQPLQSVFSGNIIDLCPVGALTSRVWRFESRPWDMNHTESICSKCSVGCNVNLWERRGQLVRVTSRENDAIDDGWICDRGRFDYRHVNDPARVRVPEVAGRPATWDDAYDALEDGLKNAKGAKLGISIPQDTTNEELFLLSKLLAGPWKGARVAMEGRTTLPPPSPRSSLRISDLDTAKTIVVVASDTRDDVPIVNLRIKKAVSKLGAKLLIVHPSDLDLDRHRAATHVRYQPGGAGAAVRGLKGSDALSTGPVAILYGDGRGTEDAADLAAAVEELAEAVGAAVMPLYRGTNERAALEMGVVAGQPDFEGVEAVFLWGAPAVPIPSSAKFVAVWDSLARESHGKVDVHLPDVTFAETQGSYTNVAGDVQFLRPILPVRSPLRERGDVLAEIGQRLGVDIEFTGVPAVQREAAAAFPAIAGIAAEVELVPPPGPVMQGPARP